MLARLRITQLVRFTEEIENGLAWMNPRCACERAYMPPSSSERVSYLLCRIHGRRRSSLIEGVEAHRCNDVGARKRTVFRDRENKMLLEMKTGIQAMLPCDAHITKVC